MTKISRPLDLSLDQISELRRAIDRTRKEVKVDKKTEHQRELIAAFARRLDDVPQEMIDEIKKIVFKSVSGDAPFQRTRRGILVPPLSTASIREYAERIRPVFIPIERIAFPIVEVIEWSLQKIDPDFVFDVQEISVMGQDEGRVPINGNELILRSDVYEGACQGNPRDIFTITHEFAHYLSIEIYLSLALALIMKKCILIVSGRLILSQEVF